MRVWPIPQGIRPGLTQPPPMYTWPAPVKRVVLLLATGVCLGIYLLIIASLLGVGLLWFA